MSGIETKNDVEERVKRLLGEYLGIAPRQIARENDLLRDLSADSLDSMELRQQLEEAFEIELTDSEQNSIPRVGDVIDVIWQHMEQKRSAGSSKTRPSDIGSR